MQVFLWCDTELCYCHTDWIQSKCRIFKSATAFLVCFYPVLITGLACDWWSKTSSKYQIKSSTKLLYYFFSNVLSTQFRYLANRKKLLFALKKQFSLVILQNTEVDHIPGACFFIILKEIFLSHNKKSGEP